MNFLMKSLIKSKLKGLPESEVDKLIGAIEKNPDFFKTLAEEVEKKSKSGMSQQDAIAEVLKSRQTELQSMFK